MSKIVFLLEEPSMKNALVHIMPKVVPSKIDLEYLPHQGKSDLLRSIPIKLRGWKEPGVTFVVIHDQDSNDCHMLKRKLIELVNKNGRPDTLIRIACRELESWFLGDFDAIEEAYGISLYRVRNKAKYRNPDSIQNAKEELKSIAPSYQPFSGSHAIAAKMVLENNRSYSFSVFIKGIKDLCETIS